MSPSSEKFIKFGEGLIGQVAKEKRPLLIDDVPPSYFNKIECALGEMIPRSLLICPILYENEVLGGISRMTVLLNGGAIPHQQVMHAIELLGTKVAPIVKKALAGSPKLEGTPLRS